MDDKGLKLLKQLIGAIEGAPYPHSVQNELYTIWHEHALNIATDALGYVNAQKKKKKSDGSVKNDTGVKF